MLQKTSIPILCFLSVIALFALLSCTSAPAASSSSAASSQSSTASAQSSAVSSQTSSAVSSVYTRSIFGIWKLLQDRSNGPLVDVSASNMVNIISTNMTLSYYSSEQLIAPPFAIQTNGNTLSVNGLDIYFSVFSNDGTHDFLYLTPTNTNIFSYFYIITNYTYAEQGVAQTWLVLNANAGQFSNGEPLGIQAKYTAPYHSPGYAQALPRLIKDLPYTGNEETAFNAPMRGRPLRAMNITTNSNNIVMTIATNWGSTNLVNLPATLVYGAEDGSKCLIYVQDDYLGSVSYDTWTNLGKNFDTNIFLKVTNAYGEPCDIDGNGRIIIFYYGLDSTSVLGFFSAADLIPTGQDYSSGREMEAFYMNLNWGGTPQPLHTEMIRTLSHEFQHLINYAQRVVINHKPQMSLWLNEGLAESSEQIVTETPGPSRIYIMTNDPNNGIRNGQNMEALGKLKPAFDRRYGTVTAGNASQITDGASCLILASEEKAKAEGLKRHPGSGPRCRSLC